MAVQSTSKTRIAASALVLFFFSLFLTAYSAKHPGAAAVGTIAITEILRPFQSVYRWGTGGVTGLWQNYIALIGVREENVQLKDRLAKLEGENSRLIEVEGELQRLRGLLTLVESEGLVGVGANVIGWDPSNWVRSITIDKGSSDGIAVGMSVLQEKGVVGQVTSVGPYTARVLLIVDPSSGVDALVQGTRARGVASGGKDDTCELQYVAGDLEDEIKVGDRVITSGMDGVYAKGLLIGTIDNMSPSGMFQSIRIRPSVDIKRLETVLVVTKPKREASLEEQRPS